MSLGNRIYLDYQLALIKSHCIGILGMHAYKYHTLKYKIINLSSLPADMQVYMHEAINIDRTFPQKIYPLGDNA